MIPVTAGAPVVAGVDGSPYALDAACWAGVEARSQNRTLHVVHASVWSMASHPAPPVVPSAHRRLMLQKAQRWVREAADATRAVAPGVEVVERLVVGDPPGVLIGESRHARIVVVGARGMDDPISGQIGSTALRLAQHAGCPVVVVRHPTDQDPATSGGERVAVHQQEGPVVVGVDSSPGGECALEFAMEYAARRGAALIALHTWSDVRINEPGGAVWQSLNWEQVRAEQDRLVAERMAGWVDKYPDVPVQRVITPDRPVRSLLDAARGARLLVLGARGRGGVPGALLGSTSQSLLHIAPCSVAIVRH